MLRRTGYTLVRELVTTDRRMGVRVRELKTSAVVAMYHSDAIEPARGGATLATIVHRNRDADQPCGSGSSVSRCSRGAIFRQASTTAGSKWVPLALTI